MQDGLLVQIICAVGAGINAVIVGSPVDVLSTRIMIDQSQGSLTALTYNIWTKEGPGAFYKGVQYNLMRLISYNIVLFVAFEQIKHHFA